MVITLLARKVAPAIPIGNGRFRCIRRGHLLGKGRRRFCDTCWKATTEKGRTGKRRQNLYHYYKRRSFGLTALEAGHRIVPGNDTETQRRLVQTRERQRHYNKTYYARWGRIDSNPIHRHRWEQIREGKWKEEEHPL